VIDREQEQVSDNISDPTAAPEQLTLPGESISTGDRPVLDVPPWDRRRDRRAVAALFLAVWVVYLLTATYDSYQVNDNRAVAIAAWSLGARGTLALPPEWEGTFTWDAPGIDGNLYTDRFPGAIFTAAPAYAIADLIGWADQPSHPIFLNFAPAGVTAATVAALSVAVLFLVFRRLSDRRTSLVAAGLFAFGTASWSVTADAMWTHGPTSLALALGTLALSSERFASSGAAFAFGILARPQTAVVPAVVGIWSGVTRRSVRPILAVGLTSVVGVAAVSVYTRSLFGSWLPLAGYDAAKVESVVTTATGDFAVRLAATMLHQDRGVLLYTPVLFLLLPFIHRGWRIAPTWVRSSAVAGAVYLVVQLRSNVWHGGQSFFGSRLTIETLVLTAPLFVCVWRGGISKDRLLRKLFWVLAGLSVVLHAIGATVLSIEPFGVQRYEEALIELCTEEDEPIPDECADLDLLDR
jgi:hypothetical protein